MLPAVMEAAYKQHNKLSLTDYTPVYYLPVVLNPPPTMTLYLITYGEKDARDRIELMVPFFNGSCGVVVE